MDKEKLVRTIVSQRVIRNAFRKSILNDLKENNILIKPNELMALLYIDAFKGLTQKDMSTYLDYDLATAGRLLDHMAKAGLITRTPNKQDARKNDIGLAKKGSDILAVVYNEGARWYKENVTAIVKTNKLSFDDKVATIAKHLTKEWGGTNGWE